MRWDDLNMGDKSRMIKLAVDSGITDLRTIRDVYNSYAEGGPKRTYEYYEDDPAFVGPAIPKDMYAGPPVPSGYGEAPVDLDVVKSKQRYMESTYNDRAYNRGSQAKGAFQITPVVLQEYTARTGNTGDLYDPVFNEEVRDWYMNVRLPEFQALKRGHPSDSVRTGIGLASFNAGPGTVNKALTKAQAAGIDTDRTFDWLEYLPKETQDYVNFGLRGKDIPGTSKTQENYQRVLDSLGVEYANGGNLFGPGGGLNPIPFSSMLYNLKSILPTKTLKKAASRIRGMQHGSESLYPKRRSDRDPGDTFLLDAKRQKEELEKLGYTEGAEGDYGLVRGAVNNLISDTHKAKVPVYQLGVDDAARDTLQVIYNGIYPKDNIPEEGQLIHAGSYPFAIYKGNNSNTYFVKSWDLNDYGKHGDSGGTTYGSRQFLADLYDKVGSPFVQTSGFKQIKDWDGKVASEDDLDISKETFKNIPYIKRQIEWIEALRADHGDAWDAWADQAIENLYTNYVNDLKATSLIPVEYRKFKSGGKIHIKPENRGKFTALKKRTGHSASWFKAYGTPAQRKMATFALNARKWKHGDGGLLTNTDIFDFN